MISIINKNEIIVRFKNGQPIKSIVKELGLARNTVRSYVRDYQNKMLALSTENDSTKITLMQELICSKPTRKSYVKKCSAFTPEIKQRFNELIKIDEERNQLILETFRTHENIFAFTKKLRTQKFKVGNVLILMFSFIKEQLFFKRH